MNSILQKLLIIGILLYPLSAMGEEVEISTTSGNIGSALSGYTLSEITSLKVNGTLDARDFKIIRDEMSKCKVIDLSGVTSINKYEGYDGTWNPTSIGGGMGSDRDGWYSYPLFELPTQSFSSYHSGSYYGWDSMPNLEKVILPSCIKTIGENIFRNSSTLQEVLIGDENKYFKSIDGVLYTKDITELYQYPSGRKGDFILPASVTTILTEGIMGASITNLTLQTATPPELNTKFTAKTVLIPKGSLAAYKSHEYWRVFDFKEIDSGSGSTEQPTVNVHQNGFTDAYISNNEGTTSYMSFQVNTISTPFRIRIKLKDPTWKDKIKINFANKWYDSDPHYIFTALTFNEEGIAWVDTDYNIDTDNRVVGGFFQFIPTTTGTMEWELAAYDETKQTCYVKSDCQTHMIEPIQVNVSAIIGEKDTEIPFTVTASNPGQFQGQDVIMRINILNADNNIEVKYQNKTISLREGPDEAQFWSDIDINNFSTSPYQLSFKSDQAAENTLIIIMFYNKSMKLIPNGGFAKIQLSETTVDNTFVVNKLKYRNTNNNTVSIVGPDIVEGSGQSGNDNDSWTVTDCVIPATITYKGITYQVKAIEDNAFCECSSLNNLEIPASITHIGEGVFDDCAKLANISVNSGNQHYTSSNGVLYNKAMTNLLVCPNMQGDNYVIPRGVKRIENGAFYSCTNLKSITLNDDLESIGECAFDNCTGLKSLTLPASLKSIEKGIVDHCNKTLEEIHCRKEIPINLGDYPEYTFFYYSEKSDICKLYVPKGTKEAYSKAPGWKEFKYILEEETSVTSFTVGQLKYTVIAADEVAISGVTDKTPTYYDIKSTVEYQSKTYQVTAIGERAFAKCINLERFQPGRVSMTIKTIGESAFSECGKLTNLLFNNGLEKIEDYAFSECSSLNNLEIPASVTYIGDGIFSDCYKLANISVSSGNQHYSSSNGVLFNKDKTTLLVCPNRQGNTNYIVPKSVTKIEAFAFDECTELLSIVLPENLKEIGGGAFYNCSKLTSITLPESLTDIGGESFGECKGIKTITIPAGVTSLGEHIFIKCDNTLQEIHCKGTTPPDICQECGYGIFSHVGTPVLACKLYVPNGSKAAYSKALGWKDFKFILEEGENAPLIPDVTEDEIILDSDSTYKDPDGNTGHFNGIIGNGEDETAINKLTIKGSASSTVTTITINKVTVGNNSSTTETATSITQNTNVVIELIGDNSLGKLVNDGIAKLISEVEASLHNTVVVNNGIFTDETGLLTKIEGTAGLDIIAPSDQEITEEKNVTLTASTKVSVTYAVTFFWEQQQPDGSWKTIGTPTVYTPTRSGLRTTASTITDQLTIGVKDAGKYRCIIQNKVGDIVSTLTTQPATVTIKSSVDNITFKKHRKVTINGQQIHFELSTPIEVNIINLNGAIIRKLSLPAGDTYIDRPDKGIYIILFEDGGTEKVRI